MNLTGLREKVSNSFLTLKSANYKSRVCPKFIKVS